MNNLFCGLHVIANLGSVANESLKEFEDLAVSNIVRQGFKTNNAHSHDILYEISKAFTVAHGYQKAGAAHYWNAYIKGKKAKNHFVNMKGERINVLFVLGGAAYFHKFHVVDFVSNFSVQTNSLLTAILDNEDEVYLASFRALGIVDKLITGPLFRLVENSNGHIFSLNQVWNYVKLKLQDLSENSSSMLTMQEDLIVPGGEITRDDVYESLLSDTHDPELDTLTQQCLELFCCSFFILLERQLVDQLPGGKFYLPNDTVINEIKSAPKHNIITERDFAQLGRKLQEKPNISTIGLTGTVMYLNNQTGRWLEKLSEADRNEYISRARAEAPEARLLFRKKQKERLEKLQIIMAEKKTKKGFTEEEASKQKRRYH